MSDTFDEPLEEHGTILESLAKARVVEISKTDKGFRFVEECDYFFGNTLSREQFLKFIEELQELARMNMQAFEFNPDNENLYEEIRELIHSQYVEHKGLSVFRLHSHSSIVRRLMYEAPITRFSAHSGADMYFYFKDKPTQSVELKTSDDLNTISLEVKTIE